MDGHGVEECESLRSGNEVMDYRGGEGERCFRPFLARAPRPVKVVTLSADHIHGVRGEDG